MAFIYEKISKDPIDISLVKVKTSLKKNGFGTLFELNFKDKFLEHGMTYDQDFYVLEVCHPGHARKILDISKTVGYFLPCKVVLYQRDNEVIVGMVKPTELIDMVVKDPQGRLIAQEVEEVIIKSLNEALDS